MFIRAALNLCVGRKRLTAQLLGAGTGKIKTVGKTMER